MAQSDSQATVEYSCSIASSRRVSDKTYSSGNNCDRDQSVYLDVSDTEYYCRSRVMCFCSRQMASQIDTLLIFSDISDTELTAASQVFLIPTPV